MARTHLLFECCEISSVRADNVNQRLKDYADAHFLWRVSSHVWMTCYTPMEEMMFQWWDT